ncbi:MAG: hypothetical protein FWE34_07125 [Defluviitaleaceae bacterium]|nr:hypothetical protein [Defluviitaleaceae bacterium]
MHPFEIYIAFLSWGDGGKDRPVLILRCGNDGILVYPITTQYESKSETIKYKLFEIKDWELSGLHKVSYIDTGELARVSVYAINTHSPNRQTYYQGQRKAA